MITVGFALCGSFCTFKNAIGRLKELSADPKINVIPIMSENSYTLDTRFGKAADFIAEIEEITKQHVLHTLPEVEPFGPKKTLDALIIAPCTGNTLAKLALGIADTPVTFAAKAHLRNERPVIVAVSTNDALAAAAKNIGALQNAKHIFFVPYRQDDWKTKPNSLVADFSLIQETLNAALEHRQLQPIILG